MQPVNICDEMTFERGGTGLQLSCSHPELPTRFAKSRPPRRTAFLAAAKISDGVRIHLQKNLPLAGGIGGGSANAAMTFVRAQRTVRLAAAAGKTARTGRRARLGRSVFSLRQAGAGHRRGEKVQSLENFPALRGKAFFLVHPGFGISTPWSYQNLARFPASVERPARPRAKIDCTLPSRRFGRRRWRNFTIRSKRPAFDKFPVLPLYQEFLRANGALVSLMSGSGSTTFAIAENLAAAEKLAEKFKSQFGDNGWTATVANRINSRVPTAGTYARMSAPHERMEHSVPRGGVRVVRAAVCRPAAVSHAALRRARGGFAPHGRLRGVLAKPVQRRRARTQRVHFPLAGHLRGAARAAADAIQKDTAETLLRKLIEQNDPRYAPAGYILAVMLERKRVLKVKEQIVRDGKRVFIYEQPKTGDMFTIADPALRLDQLEEVQRDVAQLLEHGLELRRRPLPARRIPPLRKMNQPPINVGNLQLATPNLPVTFRSGMRRWLFEFSTDPCRPRRTPNPPRLQVPRRGPAAPGADASVRRARKRRADRRTTSGWNFSATRCCNSC